MASPKLIAKGRLKLASQVSFYLASFYFSALFFLGVIIGHFTAWYLEKKQKNGRWQWWNQGLIPILKKHRLYLQMHHWIMGLVGLLLYLFIAPMAGANLGVFSGHFLILGFLGGVIAQDLLADPQWHKILKFKK